MTECGKEQSLAWAPGLGERDRDGWELFSGESPQLCPALAVAAPCTRPQVLGLESVLASAAFMASTKSHDSQRPRSML